MRSETKHAHLSASQSKAEIYWPTTLFLTLAPLAMLILVPLYAWYFPFEIKTYIFAFIFALLTNLSITAGYHRLYSHRSYEVHPIVEWIYLFIASSAFQGSAIKWSSDHRVHHSFVDSEKDPYSIKKGFWYAHLTWMFFKDSVDRTPHAPDLEKKTLLAFQHRHYVPLAIFTGFLFPTLVASLWGDALGGFLLAGLARIVLTQQSTFFVNSLCHTLGKQTYCKIISAKDSWFVALLTHGEGYHNFHHKFQIDYRNGIKWYQWDPTKWLIQLLSFFNLAAKLRMVPEAEILKAQLLAEEIEVSKNPLGTEKLRVLKNKILEAQQKLKHLQERYELYKVEFKDNQSKKIDTMKAQWEHKAGQMRMRFLELKAERKMAHIEYAALQKQWKALHRLLLKTSFT